MIIKKKTDLQLSYRKAAAVQGQSVHRELKKIYIKKKSVEEKNIFVLVSSCSCLRLGTCSMLFLMKNIYKRDREKGL